MDEIDFTILKQLIDNSRITYRELAEIIGISASSTHKRIKKLIDDEIIQRFIARPSALALKYLSILIYGISDAKSMEAVSQELGRHESVYNVAIAAGKWYYIAGFLRDISELQEFSSFVSKTAQISKPILGILNIPYITTPEPLTTIDYKILKVLNKDARKSITDIADDVGLSAKTVKKRLDRMIENYLVEFTVELKAEHNLTTGFHISLNEGTDMFKEMQEITEKFEQNAIGVLNYSNIPNFFSAYFWTTNIQDSQMINEELQNKGFKDIMPIIFLTSNNYDCWVDQLLRIK
jgi:DNA-binding Lrp family transcriptional regulator